MTSPSAEPTTTCEKLRALKTNLEEIQADAFVSPVLLDDGRLLDGSYDPADPSDDPDATMSHFINVTLARKIRRYCS